MSDAEFERELKGKAYGNEALPYVLLEWDETRREQAGAHPYTHSELTNLRRIQPTIEHIFPQDPTFDFPGRGFQTEGEYREKNDKLGNLLLLEKEINSRCRNRTPEDKIHTDSLYAQSAFEEPRRFAAEWRNADSSFGGRAVDSRTEVLAEFCKSRWHLWHT